MMMATMKKNQKQMTNAHSQSSSFFEESQTLWQSYLTTATRQCGAALSTIVDTGRLDAEDLDAVFEKRVWKKMGHEDGPMHNPRRMNKGLETKRGAITTLCNNNNHHKKKQATGHSVNGKISAVPINPTDGIDHGADYRYNKLHLLPRFHECKIWEAATYFHNMFIDVPEAMAFDLIKRNVHMPYNKFRT